MISNNTYSLNKLQMYDDCPQKYKLCYIDKVHIVEPVSKTKTGNNIHALVNYFFKGLDVTQIVSSLNPQEKLLWHNFKNSQIAKHKCVVSEYSFNVKIDEYWISGRIDALFETGDSYIIADWKTGENFTPDNVKFQTAFYLLSMYEILKAKGLIKKQEDLSLCYIDLFSDNVFNIPFDENSYWRYKTQILSVINKINECTTYFCNKTDNCKFCKYYRACPFY